MCIHRMLGFGKGIVYQVNVDIGRLSEKNGRSHTARVAERRNGT